MLNSGDVAHNDESRELCNLLIAVVSDEFDKFMGRASLEAQLALAAICKGAREVLQVTSLIHPPPAVV